MKKPSKRKPWTQLTTKELAEATREFDKPVRFEDTRPLSPRNRARLERSRKQPVYSLRIYNGRSRTIRIRIDEVLLRKLDEFAKRNDMTRDEVISRSFRSALAFVD